MTANLDIVKGIYDAFARGDIPAFLAALDEKVEWKEPVGLGPVFVDQIGPQAVAENVLAAVASRIKNFSVEPAEFFDAGDAVIDVAYYRGEGAETGKILDARSAHIWRLRDGKVVGFETITDTHLWREALGI